MADKDNVNLTLVLPIGTRVVTRVEVKNKDGRPDRLPGAVGIIAKVPSDNFHAYRVRFLDGGETSLKRHEFSLFRQFQKEGLGQGEHPLSDYNLFEHVIYRCVVGSRAYGLAADDSDLDRRGIYLPPAEMHWSLYGVPEQLENLETDEVYWELQKFINLALKANPNILECLYTPLIELATPLARELLDLRGIFLSRLIYQTYNGYVMSQFKHMERDLRNKGGLRWKHAMHLIRLLLSGVTVLKEGFVPVRVDEHRERLLAIRRGEVAWEEVNAWRLDLHRGFDAAFGKSLLPERPDYEKANAFLIKARMSMVKERDR